MPSLQEALAADASDPLAWLRQQFVITDPGVIYLDGNSLGRLPVGTDAVIAEVVLTQWGDGLTRAWADWADWPLAVGNELGRSMLGAESNETLVVDSTTLNLYKLGHAGLDLGEDRPAIVCDVGNFPTDRYILEAVASQRGRTMRWVEAPGIDGIDTDTALVSFSIVDYRTGEIADVPGITAAAHEAGALVLWDASHAVGALDLRFVAWGVDLAVGCTYKYLNAGPGAPAFAYVAHRHHRRLSPVIPGWFGHAQPFAMVPSYQPARGVECLLTGTPDIRGLAAVREGVRVLQEAGIAALRRKGMAITDFLVDCADRVPTELGLAVVSPREATRRGSHVGLQHPQAWQVCQALLARGVIADFREPDMIRLSPAPAYTTFAEVWHAMDVLRTVLEAREHEAFPADRRRIT